VYLDGLDLGEILLPSRYVPKDCAVGDMIDVFIYFDSEDRIIATTEKPYAEVDEFVFLEVVANESVGTFLDWGLQKDLLVPFSEQRFKMKVGKSYLVYVYVDKITNRIVATTKTNKHLKNESMDLKVGQEVELLITGKTDLGYNAIVDNKYGGLIFSDEVFQKLQPGQRINGFVKNIREDNKIDLSLTKLGFDKVVDLSDRILDEIKKQGGFLPINDKSSPKVIHKLFDESKKTFKKAIGTLYRKKLITIENNGIKLTDQ
ncbi:MAG: S1-like domain-containing RNA-binding protein, partial [Candidatus Marinimicrobia bacterium]|nr:S1-like domain-containing RNA-binding protein [Candidatus Neomarinimicrobiota bacterium]